MVRVDVMLRSHFVRLEIILSYVHEISEVCPACGPRIERTVSESNLRNPCQISGQSIARFLTSELSQGAYLACFSSFRHSIEFLRVATNFDLITKICSWALF